MDFGIEKAQKALDKEIAEAEEYLKNPSKIDDVLMQAEEKLKAVPVIGSTLAGLPLMISMIKAWITQEYTVVSPKVIACMVGAILYLIKRKDLISDSIPIVGYADDLAVVGLALKLCEKELQDFSEWRKTKMAGTVQA